MDEKRKLLYKGVLYVVLVIQFCSLGFLIEKSRNNKMKETVALNVKTSESVEVINSNMVAPSGKSIGIYMETEGILVLGVSEVTSIDGKYESPCQYVLRSGDYILEVNGTKIYRKEEIESLLEAKEDGKVTLLIRRKGEEFEAEVNPVIDKDGKRKLGIWIRDNMQGIGTLTYVTETTFSALGHGINDLDTMELVQIKGGSIYEAKVLNIVKGEAGSPGEIIGSIDYSETNKIGEINKNDVSGISGKYEGEKPKLEEYLPVASKEEIKTGRAYIKSYVSGEEEYYEINILEVHQDYKEKGKEMKIEIVDKDLIELTNGIVQGLSGTPIIQNGKVVGAITHVFVQDSKMGYGTFIENMMVVE